MIRTRWKCKQCSQYFERRYYRSGFCSIKCVYIWRTGKIRGSNKKRTLIQNYKEKQCKHCKAMYIPTSGKQLYCGKCSFHCKVCGKETAIRNWYCRSCWQLGSRNNAHKASTKRHRKLTWEREGRVNPMQGKKHKKSTLRLFSKQRSGPGNSNFGKVTYGTGRCKWFDYTSPIAGEVKLQGTYELRMANVLDKLHWGWKKTSDRFEYDNGNHCYIPDFKIYRREKEKCLFYIDTKGWFSDQEKIKIAKVREENSIILIIMDNEMLNQYERRVA